MTTVPEKFERLKDKFIPSALRSRKQSHAKTTSEGRSDVAIPSSQIHTEETVAHTPLYAQRDPLTDGSTALVPTHMGMQSSELRSSGVHPVTQGALDVEPSTMDTAPLSGHPFESVEDRTMQQPNDTSHWNITSPVKSNGEQDHVPRKVTEIPSAQVFISEIESVAGASSRAEKWKDACGNFEVEHPKSYEKLTACLRVFQEHGTSKEPDVSKLPHSRQLVSKLRRYLPIHAAIRSTVMPIAALDPQKIAPICCAALFTLVELCLGIPNPEAYNKTLEAFLEAVSTIQEWTSFETKYVPRVESSNSNIAEINAGLPDLYVKCLLLIADIQHSFHRGPVPSKFAFLLNESAKWEMDAKSIRIQRAAFSSKRKLVEEHIATQGEDGKLLAWIKKDDDKEQTLRAIKDRVNPKEKYKNQGESFLESETYNSWYDAVQDHNPSGNPKRVFWLNGSYGIGKTTIVHRILVNFQELEKTPIPQKPLRVVSYFCAAQGPNEERPECETVLRSLASKLSWQPDLCVAKPAMDFYTRHAAPGKEKPSMADWVQLLHDLLLDCGKVAIIVDGLDAFKTNEEGEKFLKYMDDMVQNLPGVYLFCASHRWVHVEVYFSGPIYEHELQSLETKKDMGVFIDEEIQSRRRNASSIFFEDEGKDLLQALKLTLATHAKGMFLWVEAWLNIVLPKRYQETIRSRKVAERRLEEMKNSANPSLDAMAQLNDAFSRLWIKNRYPDYETERRNLFRLVLCSQASLTIAALTQALHIQVSDDGVQDKSLTEEFVESLGDDFLMKGAAGHVIFVNDAARAFMPRLMTKDVEQSNTSSAAAFNDKDNHQYVAMLYIAVMSYPFPDHQFWTEAGFTVEKWALVQNYKHMGSVLHYMESRLMDGGREKSRYWSMSFRRYILAFGLHHCRFAADTQSIFDPVWQGVFDNILMRTDPLSCFIAILASFETLVPTRERLADVVCCFFTWNDEVPLASIRPRYASIAALCHTLSEKDLSEPNEKQSQRLAILLRKDSIMPNERDIVLRSLKEIPSALHVAVMVGNLAAIPFLVNGVRSVHGYHTALKYIRFPLGISSMLIPEPTTRNGKEILGILLEQQLRLWLVASDDPDFERPTDRRCLPWNFEHAGLHWWSNVNLEGPVNQRKLENDTYERLRKIWPPEKNP